jgi:DNA-nicking Smr family endonuclease
MSTSGVSFSLCRNANIYGNSSSTLGQPRLLDLHGLHVNEAISMLKREIGQLRLSVRSTRQREQVFICVGTGHHTKGSRTPARLPIAVQQYLMEEEHLPFTETQPGMLRVIVR